MKNQMASYNFKLGFALSNRPHFIIVYLVRVPFLTSLAVYEESDVHSDTCVLRFLDILSNLVITFINMYLSELIKTSIHRHKLLRLNI